MTTPGEAHEAAPNFRLSHDHRREIQSIAARKRKLKFDEQVFEDIESRVRFSLSGGVEKPRADKEFAADIRQISSGAEKIANAIRRLHDDFGLQEATFRSIDGALTEAGWQSEDPGDSAMWRYDRDSVLQWAPVERLARAFDQIAGELAAYADNSSLEQKLAEFGLPSDGSRILLRLDDGTMFFARIISLAPDTTGGDAFLALDDGRIIIFRAELLAKRIAVPQEVSPGLKPQPDTTSSRVSIDNKAQQHAFRPERAVPAVLQHLDDIREKPLLGLGITCAHLYIEHFSRPPKAPTSGGGDKLGPFGDFLKVVLQAAQAAGFKVNPGSARRLAERTVKAIHIDTTKGAAK